MPLILGLGYLLTRLPIGISRDMLYRVIRFDDADSPLSRVTIAASEGGIWQGRTVRGL